LVGRDDLPNAIALNSAAFNIARVLGPAVAGILVGWVGEQACFWGNAVSFVPVLISLTMIRTHAPATGVSGVRDTLQKLGEGVRYALEVTPIRNLLLLLGFAAGLGFQYTTLLPVYAREVLHVGPREFGLMVSMFGVGSLAAAIAMTR